MRLLPSASCTRRSLLRGLGVGLALPWLESVPLYGADPAPAKAEGAPIRLLVSFSGNGFHGKEWWAKGEGAAMELGKVLTSLTPVRGKLTLVDGLFHVEAGKGGIHSAQTGNIFSGAPLQGGGGVRSGTSFDQVVAQKLGDRTRLPSFVVGCEDTMPGIHKGYSMLYSSHISWSSPTMPTPVEIRPALAFDQLFRTDARATDRSVLDAVREDAKGLERRISVDDRRRLDAYLGAVREVEQRIERAGRPRAGGWKPTMAKPALGRPKDGVPENLGEHLRIMAELCVLAIATDTTRVVSFKLNNDHSAHRFPHIGVDHMIHHLMSHTDNEPWLTVNQHHVEQIAYIAQRLDSIAEGPRTALDNTVMLFTSSMRTGGNHNGKNLPVAIIGGAGGRLKGGRRLDCEKAPDRRMCSLFLSLMDCMDVTLDRFGDSDRRLDGFLG